MNDHEERIVAQPLGTTADFLHAAGPNHRPRKYDEAEEIFERLLSPAQTVIITGTERAYTSTRQPDSNR
ncbi:MAG TPA: hypothetical protein VGF48_23140 [Thermoanaerobaculia bacterium]